MGARKNLDTEEMLKMRYAGMTNTDIANALGVTHTTVWKYIGPQPGKNWAEFKERMKQAPIVPMPEAKVEVIPEPVIAACLAITNRKISLAGTACKYGLDMGKKLLRVKRAKDEEGPVMEFPLDELGDIINELSAIARKLPELAITPEMW